MVVVVLKASQKERHHVGVQPSKDAQIARRALLCDSWHAGRDKSVCVCVCVQKVSINRHERWNHMASPIAQSPRPQRRELHNFGRVTILRARMRTRMPKPWLPGRRGDCETRATSF